MTKRYFEFSDGSSNKFWEIRIDGSEVFTRYGKIGAAGATTVKDEGSDAKAQKLYDKLVNEKTRKGYVEKGSAPADDDADDDDDDDDDEDEDDEDDDRGEIEDSDGDDSHLDGDSGARRFEHGGSKFWEIRVEGSSHTVKFGKIGTDGQEKTKDFASDALAQKDADKLIAEKTKKGYEEV